MKVLATSLMALLKSSKFPSKRIGLLACFFWLALLTPAWAKKSVELRVEIEDGAREVTVGTSTKAVVKDASGKVLGELTPMTSFAARSDGGAVSLDQWRVGAVFVEPTAGGYVFIGDRWYRGKALVVPKGAGVTAVNYVDLEHYLYSVLGGEMNGNWPQEALKAQAVAARSYALYHRAKATNRVFDVGDTPAWQVYRGLQDESSGTQTAVNATAGQVLTSENQIIEAVFHSSAGGCTDNVEEIWVQALPYLRSVPDYDQGTPVYEWTKTVSQAELNRLIPGIGNVRSFIPERSTTTCKRVISMRVEGDKGSRTLKGSQLRDMLDLRSTLFRIDPIASSGEKNLGSDVTFQVTGRGFGHGLGLSQWGAYNMALRYGQNYRQILAHYYRNTELQEIQPR